LNRNGVVSAMATQANVAGPAAPANAAVAHHITAAAADAISTKVMTTPP
jgi:hypothetical protein